MKEKIIDCFKFMIFFIVTIVGFFSIYAIMWVQLGLPINRWASLIVFTLTGLSEWGYIKWLAH